PCTTGKQVMRSLMANGDGIGVDRFMVAFAKRWSREHISLSKKRQESSVVSFHLRHFLHEAIAGVQASYNAVR
ncbi:MAG: hypothetical protein KDB22_19510, partial [Planctomycetales bacterium]|nr:hypothetical protein [Planctomycetales bacterium]